MIYIPTGKIILCPELDTLEKLAAKENRKDLSATAIFRASNNSKYPES